MSVYKRCDHQDVMAAKHPIWDLSFQINHRYHFKWMFRCKYKSFRHFHNLIVKLWCFIYLKFCCYIYHTMRVWLDICITCVKRFLGQFEVNCVTFWHYLYVLEKQSRQENLGWLTKSNYLEFSLFHQALSLRLRDLIDQQKFLVTWFSWSCPFT